MTDHTPGPWEVEELARGEHWHPTVHLYIVNGPEWWSQDAYEIALGNHADARLIAAAPRLLKVLKDALAEESTPNDMSDWAIEAREVIAEIEGVT